MSLRELILSAKPQSQVEDVPEWGCQVTIQEMSGEDRDQLYATATDAEGTVIRDKFVRQLLIRTLRDPATGECIFKPEDADELYRTSGSALQRLTEIALELNGLRKGDVAEARKN